MLSQEKYNGDCVESLIAYLDDKENGFRSRNSAIWALGQLGDERALPVLKKYYIGYNKEKINRSKELAQLELKRAIGYMEGNLNITKFFWNFESNINQGDTQAINLLTEENFVLSPRDEAITQYLLTQEQFSWQTKKDSSNYCVFENLGNEEDIFPLSLWVYCQEYKQENEEIIELSGFSGPVLVDYPNELSFFSIDKFTHQVPRDGSLYGEDIEKIFPENLQKNILNYQGQGRLNKILKQNIIKINNIIN